MDDIKAVIKGESMSMIAQCIDGEHSWEWEKPKEYTGKNILGKEVTCIGSDGNCPVCGAITWKKIESKEEV